MFKNGESHILQIIWYFEPTDFELMGIYCLIVIFLEALQSDVDLCLLNGLLRGTTVRCGPVPT